MDQLKTQTKGVEKPKNVGRGESIAFTLFIEEFMNSENGIPSVIANTPK
jgi:hypothetical protein